MAESTGPTVDEDKAAAERKAAEEKAAAEKAAELKRELNKPNPNEPEGLFLLEVLIDKINFYIIPCFADKDFKTYAKVSLPGQPSMEPLIIEEDTSACTAASRGFVKNFNVGKSCLFVLNKEGVRKALNKFLVEVSVYKTLPCGCLPTRIVLGMALIDLTKEFVTSRHKYVTDPTSVNCEALRDTFILEGLDKKSATGEISMYLRISCFGKLIVTKFQGAGGQVTLGAATAPMAPLDKSCDPPRMVQAYADPCICGTGSASTGQVNSTSSKQSPSDPCYCSGHRPKPKVPVACRNTEAYCLHVPQGRTNKYEEVGTTLTGNELKIKVPKASAVIKRISQTHCAIQRPYDKDNRKDGHKGPCDPPCGKNQISVAFPMEDTCCEGVTPADTQFTCTTEGCAQIGKHGAATGIVRPDPKDPNAGEGFAVNKDVFVLKVAKTAHEGEKKCKLEMELVAPKAGNKRLPIQKRNAIMQSNECNCCRRRCCY